jgi:hypothetical protein
MFRKAQSFSVVLVCVLLSLSSPLLAQSPRVHVEIDPYHVSNAYFRDSNSNPFYPKGYSYVLPEIFTGEWDEEAIDDALSQMASRNATVVRLIIFTAEIGAGTCSGGGCVSGTSSDRLPDAYMDNVVTFLSIAESHGLYVVISFDTWLAPSYGNIINSLTASDRDISDTLTSQLPHPNTAVLDTSWLVARKTFLSDFVHEIKIRDESLLSTILLYCVSTEITNWASHYPYSESSGTITTADEVQYDMSIPGDRDQMYNANFVNFATHLAEGIKNEDEDALVSIDVSGSWQATSGAPSNDPWIYLFPRAAVMSLYAANIDVLDYHFGVDPVFFVMGDADDFDPDLYLLSSRSEFYAIDLTSKVVVDEEFAVQDAYVTQPYYDSTTACEVLPAHFLAMVNSGFAGGMLWTWNWIDQDFGVWNTGVGDDYQFGVANCLAAIW